VPTNITQAAVPPWQQRTQIATALDEQGTASGHLHDVTSKMSDHIGEIHKATKEQASATKMLAEETERVRDIALHVKRSADEQSLSARGIGDAMENIAEDIGAIRGMLEEQKKDTERIARAANTVPGKPQANHAVAQEFNPPRGDLKQAREVFSVAEDPGPGPDVGRYWLNTAMDRGDRLMGFGHRVYKNYDPRATIIRETCHKVLARLGHNQPLFELALRLEEIALKDPYFVEKKLYPNVDFYSGIIYRALGIPKSMYTVMFAIARTVGWVAHWTEMITDPDGRIGRPRQLYTGPTTRDYVDVAMRSGA